jgi:manganese/zinc/iron transport system permease protein
MAALGGVALLAVGLFWKEFKLLAFDANFARSLGWPVRTLDVGLTTLIVIAIVIGLQTVGVVLMSAMIVAPGAAARQWTDRLGVMTALSMAFGATAGVAGTLLSSQTANLPTGPTIVLCVSVIVVVSLLGAPHRGLVARWIRQRRRRRELRLEAVLLDLYALAQQHDAYDYPHPVATLEAMSTHDGGIERSLDALAERDLVRRTDAGRWALTEAGHAKADTLRDRHGPDPVSPTEPPTPAEA